MKGYINRANRADETSELRKRLLIDLESLSARLLEAEKLAERADVGSVADHVATARWAVNRAKVFVERIICKTGEPQ